MFEDSSLLRIPGPTPIPPSVKRAMDQPMIGHRGAETKALLKRIKPKLRPIFGTEDDVMILTGSGTSGLETAVVNTTSAGDDVLVVVTGAFGERFANICEAYQLNTHILNVTWGEAANPEEIKAFVKAHPNLKAVFMTYCETSTGLLNPIAEMSQVVHEQSDALVIVDGVSCIGGTPAKMDAWQIDVFVTGSQKALMLPGGLTFVAVSERAWQVIETNSQSRFYLDLRKYRDQLNNDATPFTPGLSLLFGLEESLRLLEKEGLDHVYKRHELMMEMTRSAMRSLEIPLLTPDDVASPTVTAAKPDEPEKLRQHLKQEFGLQLAGGQQHLKEKIIRIGHMGYCAPKDILQIIGLLEIGLKQTGHRVNLSAGVKAAQTTYLQWEAERG